MNDSDLKKMYYSISEVANMLNVPASTLRYWEKELSSVSPRRSVGGTRKYTTSDIDELRILHRLVTEEGHTIEGVKKKLRRRRNVEVNKKEVLKRLTAIRSELMGMLDEYERISKL